MLRVIDVARHPGRRVVLAERMPVAHIFETGQLAVGTNHTDLRPVRRRTPEEVQALHEGLGELLREEGMAGDNTTERVGRRLATFNPGICDSQCPRMSDLGFFDRIFFPFKGDQFRDCGGDQQCEANDLCWTCFEWAKVLELFNFNWDVQNDEPVDKLYDLEELGFSAASGMRCYNCYAYVGASVVTYADWTTNTWQIREYKLQAGGAIKYNLNFTASNGFEFYQAFEIPLMMDVDPLSLIHI